MKLLSMRRWIYVFVLILFVACKNNDESGNGFAVNGVIANNKEAKKVYLVELPAGTTQGTVVDSFTIDKEGKYNLKTGSKESVLYGIRLDQHPYPVAYVINDVPKISVDITLSDKDNQFADKYEVKGSPVSQEMKDFMTRLDDDLQKIYALSQKADSLKKLNAPDSLIMPIAEEWRSLGKGISDYSHASFEKAKDPALFLFELGAYESIAETYRLQSLGPEEEVMLITKVADKFPAHKGLNEIKKGREARLAQYKKMNESQWVGKQAPDFSLPDASGKEIALSSFRGKYVLIDFWASWCGPCRQENPNVVKAYQTFKDKNFAILGVSLDEAGEKDKWLNAVAKDKLTWTQVSDLKGWKTIVQPLYGFNGIPYNVLVDPGGIIIAENLRGASLEAKLGEVLK